MPSRFAIIAAKFNRALFTTSERRFPAQFRGGATSSGRTADPAEHAVDEEDVYPTDAMQDERRRRPPEKEPTSKDNESYFPPKPPKEISAKLKSHGVSPKTGPLHGQKRQNSTDLNCTTINDTWPSDAKDSDRREQREEQEEEDREYFKHHKASPLSEIEVCDTRKPVTQATDGTAHSESVGDDVGWRPEQLDTAEESLRRAVEIFRTNAARGGSGFASRRNSPAPPWRRLVIS